MIETVTSFKLVKPWDVVPVTVSLVPNFLSLLGLNMKINIKEKKTVKELMEQNNVGVKVNAISVQNQLVRSVLANMLWEDSFYESGEDNVKRLEKLVGQNSPVFVSQLAELARTKFKLRHVPLKLMRELARHGKLKADDLANVIQRPDEIGEFLSIYWKEGKTPIANQVKKGLAKSFDKFNEFQLSKWDKGSSAISLRDAMFLVHANPKGREDLFKRIANQELGIADTWETALSAGANKKETFERLMAEGRLGALAFLRNLRNMVQAGVSELTIREYSKTVKVGMVLPFRYLAAARIVPQFTDMLENMLFRSLADASKLKGRTLLVVDISGSMNGSISSKSDLSRIDAAKALTILAREVCEDVVIFATAGNDSRRTHATVRIPAHRGFALGEYLTSAEVRNKIGGGGVFMQQCMNYIKEQNLGAFDRVIVFTDEQDCDHGRNPADAALLGNFNYVLNVGAYKNGVNSDKWTTITGFSESVIDYIQAVEEF